MTITRARHAKLLQEGLNTVFGLEYKRHPEQWREIFDTETSVKAYEEDVMVYGFGGAFEKPEGSAVQYDEGGQAWTARYTHLTYALAFRLTEEAQEDNLYLDIGKKYSKALARSFQYSKEVNAASVINFGYDTNYTGGDGKPLFATDHPLQGGGSISNRLATPAQLSEASLEDAVIDISLLVDERGQPIIVNPTCLIIPPTQTFQAERILYSELRVGTGNNDINALRRRSAIPQGFKENRYLSSRLRWFLKTDVSDGLKHFERVKLQKKMEGDFETGNLRYKARERYSFGWTDWRAAYGSGAI